MNDGVWQRTRNTDAASQGWKRSMMKYDTLQNRCPLTSECSYSSTALAISCTSRRSNVCASVCVSTHPPAHMRFIFYPERGPSPRKPIGTTPHVICRCSATSHTVVSPTWHASPSDPPTASPRTPSRRLGARLTLCVYITLTLE